MTTAKLLAAYDLAGAGADTIARWVAEALEFYRAAPQIMRVEWKTRGHDHAPGLHEALLANGFGPDETESVMIGDAGALDVDVPLPPGVSLRRLTDEPDIRAMSAMQDEVFGSHVSDGNAEAILRPGAAEGVVLARTAPAAPHGPRRPPGCGRRHAARREAAAAVTCCT